MAIWSYIADMIKNLEYDIQTNSFIAIVVLVIILSIPLTIAVAYIILKRRNNHYVNFVEKYSAKIKAIREINSRYTFFDVERIRLSNSYDNENFYLDISPKDYLTYQLVYDKKRVLADIAAIDKNNENFAKYSEEISNIRDLDGYEAEKIPRSKKKLEKTESQLFDDLLLKPKLSFSINVVLVLTNINGDYKESISRTFNKETVLDLIDELNNKRGDFYQNSQIWESICRVERGKVSNKMRFAVYKRDGNRCRRCGSRYDLEVDHIFPISKGGKSNFDNLQTLCHDCNLEKSNTVEYGAVNPKAVKQNVNVICKMCGASMVRKKGKYGDFYACPNYPKCKFTQNIED